MEETVPRLNAEKKKPKERYVDYVAERRDNSAGDCTQAGGINQGQDN